MISFFKKDNFEHDRICVIDDFLPEPIYRNVTDYAFLTNSFISHTDYTPHRREAFSHIQSTLACVEFLKFGVAYPFGV